MSDHRDAKYDSTKTTLAKLAAAQKRDCREINEAANAAAKAKAGELFGLTEHANGRAFFVVPRLADITAIELAWAVVSGLSKAAKLGYRIDRAGIEMNMTNPPINHALTILLRKETT